MFIYQTGICETTAEVLNLKSMKFFLIKELLNFSRRLRFYL
jgi:hypothetical protein